VWTPLTLDPCGPQVFLQGGSNDLNNQFGSWPLANQEMAAALEYAGCAPPLTLCGRD
jgi:hypothetical protein